jgi:hypothetical protein
MHQTPAIKIILFGPFTQSFGLQLVQAKMEPFTLALNHVL